MLDILGSKEKGSGRQPVSYACATRPGAETSRRILQGVRLGMRQPTLRQEVVRWVGGAE